MTPGTHVEGPSSDVVARTSTGDIRVEASEPGTIEAQADTGDIHISVPDLITYAVDVQTTPATTTSTCPDDLRRGSCARTPTPATCTWSPTVS